MVASRTPGKAQLSLQDGLREALVVLAVPAHAIYTLPLDKLPKDGVVVDCSNRTRRCAEDEVSQAEQLAAALPPGPSVVKALNTVSGYFLEQVGDAEADLDADDAVWSSSIIIPVYLIDQVTEQSVKPVPIASDSGSAKVKKYDHLYLSSNSLIMVGRVRLTIDLII